MTGQKKPKCNCKKKSKKTTTPRVIGLYGVKITKGMNERKASERESKTENKREMSERLKKAYAEEGMPRQKRFMFGSHALEQMAQSPSRLRKSK